MTSPRTSPGTSSAPIPSLVRGGRHFLTSGGRSIVPVGTHYVPPSGPDWPWRVGVEDFDSAFAAMAAEGLTTVRIDLLWAAVEPAEGALDEAHLTVLDGILDSAARHGLWLHPTFFIGGEVGDAYWDLPWARGRNPHRDADLLRAQVEHVRTLAARWRGHPAILAWDLTDEPPAWIFGPETTDEDARTWTAALTAALRDVDPEHLVTVGTASQDVGWGPFRADVIAPWLDFACVHPYPIFDPLTFPEGIVGRRMTHAAAFETALARGAGRPVMVHEFGASSTQYAPERIAAYDRLLTWSSLGRGAIGFYSWCWIDAEPAAHRRAPYVRSPHETQFGMHEHDGTPRPRATELSALAATLGHLDLDRYAAEGPVRGALTIVPHEYVHPYDPAAYGLDDAPSGPYTPTEPVWRPDRDVAPLVRSWLSSFLLTSASGAALDFVRERLDGALPDPAEHPLLLLPAPLTTCSTSLHALRPNGWRAVRAYAEEGGTVLLSCSADTAIPELADLAGVRILDRAPVDATPHLTFVEAFGSIEAGTVITLPATASHDLHRRAVILRSTGARVLAVDGAGHPALTELAVGEGRVVTCSHPLELLLAAEPDDPFAAHDVWRIHRALAEVSHALLPARVEHPDITCGVLTGSGGGLLVATNHTGCERSGQLVLPEGVTGAHVLHTAPAAGARPSQEPTVLHPTQPRNFSNKRWQKYTTHMSATRRVGLGSGDVVTIAAYGVLVLTWDTHPTP